MAVDLDELEPMSQNAFAKFSGVSTKTASLWKSKGYLTFLKDGLVDAKSSAITLMERGLGKFEELDEGNTSQEMTVTPEEGNTPVKEVTPEQEADEVIGTMAKIFDSFQVGSLLSYSEAERVEKNFAALRIRLIYEREAAKLVDKDESEVRFAEILSTIRDSWENWPSGVCGEMAQELGVNQRKLRIALERYVRKQIEAYVSAIEAEDDESED